MTTSADGRLVSAIIPTFNRRDLVQRAVRSAVAQTHLELEIIVVDDGSTDATEEAVRGIDARGRVIRYVRKENGGCASARNEGVRVARGDLIAFLDSDDEWLPPAISSLVTALEESGADFVFSPNVEAVDAHRQYVNVPTSAGAPERFAADHLFHGARVCSLLYTRRIFDRACFDETLRNNEDWDFLQRVALNFKASYCDVTTAIVHHHRQNKSRNVVENARSLLRSTEAIFAEYPAFRESLGEAAEARLHALRVELVRGLLAGGDPSTAREVAAGTPIGPPLDLLLRLGWGAPLRWQGRFARIRDLADLAMARAVALRSRIRSPRRGR